MISQFQEVACDACGSAEPYPGSKAAAEVLARENGWIITREKKCYCDKKCHRKGKS